MKNKKDEEDMAEMEKEKRREAGKGRNGKEKQGTEKNVSV